LRHNLAKMKLQPLRFMAEERDLMMKAVAALLLLLAAAGSPALADTAAGVAAYERGDYQQARALLEPEAERGDAEAQVKLGLIYARGLGVARDASIAVPWFRKSAEQGNAEGQYSLGVAYDLGDTGATDLEQAAIWYQKSAEQGFAKAQYNLGHLLLNGGAAEKYEEGAAWVLKAAEQDHADAMYLYGNACGGGRGVEQNLLCARYWLRRAVDHGVTKAQKNLDVTEDAIGKIEAAGAPRTEGGDGSTPERAIKLLDAKNESDGVTFEHKAAAYYFRGWTWKGQSLITRLSPNVYDQIEMIGPNGAARSIYFDITNWFGRMD
jgi:TPR repeat protein